MGSAVTTGISPPSRLTPSPGVQRWREYTGAVLLATLVLIEGLFAASLQRVFYQRSGPFFDSLAYFNQMAVVWSEMRSHGLLAALRSAWSGGTVILPWIETALLAPAVPLARELAVWLQSTWLLILALSIYYYLVHWRRLSVLPAVCLTLPFFGFRTMFYYNGGLSDFRMDLSLYLFTSLAVVWYLGTYKSKSRVPWLLCGCFSALACLTRATSPAYLICMLGPLLFIRFLSRPRTWPFLVKGCLYILLPVLAIALPYLVLKWDYLYFYYAVWNADANANLPLRESIHHFKWVMWNIGISMTWLLLSACLLQLTIGLWDSKWSVPRWIGGVDWKLIWIGLAPAGFLALRGAGLNPFVSMPSIFGLLLFAVAPMKSLLRRGLAGNLAASVLAVAAVSFNVSASQTLQAEGQIATPSMPALRQAIDWMEKDATAHGLTRVNYATVYVGLLHFITIQNVLTFEYHGRIEGGGVRDPHGILFTVDEAQRYTAAVPVDWERNADGKTDQQKIAGLVKLANQKFDYLFLPDDATAEMLERDRAYFFMNTKVRALKSQLLKTGAWQLTGPLLDMRLSEKIEIYRRVLPRAPIAAMRLSPLIKRL